jgi:flavodoxin
MEGRKMEKNENILNDTGPLKSLVVVFSYHHMNTEKIAHAIAKALDAPVTTPQQVNPEGLHEYDLIGLGSGIYAAQNHPSLLDLAGNLPLANGRKAFIFSTFGAPAGLFKGERLTEFIHNNHRALREKLQSRGYTVIGEFACAGFNTNSFLKYLGGLNKGRPDEDDLKQAEEFAGKIKLLAGRDNPAGEERS